MHHYRHHGAPASGLAAPDAALKDEDPASGGRLGLQADQERTNSPNCAAAAAAALEAAEFIGRLTGTASPAEVKNAIVLAACLKLIMPTAAHCLIQALGLLHA